MGSLCFVSICEPNGTWRNYDYSRNESSHVMWWEVHVSNIRSPYFLPFNLSDNFVFSLIIWVRALHCSSVKAWNVEEFKEVAWAVLALIVLLLMRSELEAPWPWPPHAPQFSLRVRGVCSHQSGKPTSCQQLSFLMTMSAAMGESDYTMDPSRIFLSQMVPSWRRNRHHCVVLLVP